MRPVPRHLLLPGLVALGLGLGFLREVVVAREIGAGAEMDAYAAVFGIYLFFGTQMANATTLTFIAQYARLSDSELLEHCISVFAVQCLIMLPVAVVLVGWSAPLVDMLFAFDPARHETASRVASAFAPAVFLGAQVGVLRAILNIRGSFAPGFLVAPLLSAVVIGMLLVADRPDVLILPQGYFFGNVLVLAMLAWVVWKRFRGIPFRISLRRGWSLWRFGYLVLIAEVVFQASYTLERSVASGFSTGTVASFFYSVALTSVFVAMVVQPVSVVYFPRMSRLFKDDPDEGMRLLMRVGGGLFLASLVVVVLVGALALPVVELVFMRGAFGAEDAVRTAGMLEIVVFALPFMSVGRMIKNALYARGAYVSPLVVNLSRLTIFVVLAFLVMVPLSVEDFAWAYVAGVASVSLTGLAFLLLTRNRMVSADAI